MDSFTYGDRTISGTTTSGTVTFPLTSTVQNYTFTVQNYTFTLPDAVVAIDHKAKCELLGHQMSQEVEWCEGGVFGKCEVCGTMIHGRRIPGGLAVSQLRKLVHSSLDGDTALEGLAADVLRMQDLIDAEDRALEEARSLLALAKRKIAQRALPNFE